MNRRKALAAIGAALIAPKALAEAATPASPFAGLNGSTLGGWRVVADRRCPPGFAYAYGDKKVHRLVVEAFNAESGFAQW